MFWKKKDDDVIDFTFETDNKRQAFRVIPPDDFTPIITTADEKKQTLPVHDISAGGFSFEAEGVEGFKVGETYQILLHLPEEQRPMPVGFELLSFDAENICHCRFLDLSEKNSGKIYLYVLTVQKMEFF